MTQQQQEGNDSNSTNIDDPSPVSSSSSSSEKDTIIYMPVVIGDLFAMALASQLLGLSDVLNRPEFYANGGWFQPISIQPTTLPLLVQRFSILSISWFSAAYLGKSLSLPTSSSSTSSLPHNLLIVLSMFLVAVTALEFISSIIIGANNQLVVDPAEVLRLFYFATIVLLTGRFVLSKSPYA